MFGPIKLPRAEHDSFSGTLLSCLYSAGHRPHDSGQPAYAQVSRPALLSKPRKLHRVDGFFATQLQSLSLPFRFVDDQSGLFSQGVGLQVPQAMGQASLAPRVSGRTVPCRLQRSSGLALTQPQDFSLPFFRTRVHMVLSRQAPMHNRPLEKYKNTVAARALVHIIVDCLQIKGLVTSEW